MAKSKDQLEYLDAMIGRLLVLDPDMSLRDIQMHLEENGLHAGDLNFISRRREKVRRRAIARASRMTKIINASEYNGRVNHALEVLMKLTTKDGTPPGVKARAAEAITNISHKRLMTFTLLGIYMSDIKQGGEMGEKEFPAETFDTIMEAINNNQLRPRAGAFKYLPEAPVIEKINQTPDANASTKPADRPKFFTTIPFADDRSFALPPRQN